MTQISVDLHEASEIVSSIVRPTLESGGDFINVLALLETVVAGVIHIGVKPQGHELVLDLLMKQIRAHLAELGANKRDKMN